MTEYDGVGRSSATDELRRMLDERGVEWKEHKHAMSGSMAIQRETLWGQPTDVASGKPIPHVYHYRATEMGDGRLFLEAQLVTPEQAIAATLGSGECHMRLVYEEEDADGFVWPDHYECSVCGANVNGIMPSYDTEIQPRYCPNCGRKVVDES